MLGEAGATVYCTGRSVRGNTPPGRPETIEETAEMVTDYGGVGVPVAVDHLKPDQVEALFQRVQTEQGRLDILVNDIWGGDELAEWGKPFWEQSLARGFTMMERAIHTHIITSHFGAPLMVNQGSGLIVEITDGDSPSYRGNFFYDLCKVSVIRMALAMNEELRPHGVTALAVTPGFLRSEAMLDLFGVSEANWRDGVEQDENFIASETPYFVGRAVASLAADPNVAQKGGGVYSSWGLSDEYGFSDIDGNRPHWGRYFEAKFGGK
jgi:NAD(P)-dependent dehydrogenase (short-subunit alcohol dehydrogenase family)